MEDEEFRVYKIELVVTDPDVSAKTIRWLLNEAGEINSIEEE